MDEHKNIFYFNCGKTSINRFSSSSPPTANLLFCLVCFVRQKWRYDDKSTVCVMACESSSLWRVNSLASQTDALHTLNIMNRIDFFASLLNVIYLNQLFFFWI